MSLLTLASITLCILIAHGTAGTPLQFALFVGEYDKGAESLNAMKKSDIFSFGAIKKAVSESRTFNFGHRESGDVQIDSRKFDENVDQPDVYLYYKLSIPRGKFTYIRVTLDQSGTIDKPVIKYGGIGQNNIYIEWHIHDTKYVHGTFEAYSKSD